MPDTPQPPPAQPPINDSPSAAIEIGYAVSISNYLIWVNGLPNVRINEIVQTKEKARGIVTAITEDLVGVLMLDDAKVKPKEEFIKTNTSFTVSASNKLLGRVINPMGQPIDGKGPLGKEGQNLTTEQVPPGIKTRERITRQFETGVMMVDMLVPVAYGQRELVIGDPHSGKTGFLVDSIVNQKKGNVVCVLALIGKPLSDTKNIISVLSTTGALNYTVIVSTSSSERASVIYLTPSVATTIAEFFQKKGLDVLLILDDLGVHAKFYREISLLSGKPPGRESYPGDIFYQHAKLIERAGSFNKTNGGGSITAFPVIETGVDDFSSYMTTNLMGMTDGHLMFTSSRYRQGFRPSIDVSLSVSRVGRQTQSLIQKALADRIKTILADSSRLQAFSRMGSEVSEETQKVLKQGAQIEEVLKQLALNSLSLTSQIILLSLTFSPFLASKDINFVAANKEKIINYLKREVDLKKWDQAVSKMTTLDELIKSVAGIASELEKLTQEKK